MADIYNLENPNKIKVLIFNHTKFRNRRVKSRPAQIGLNLANFFLSNFGQNFDVSHFYDLSRDQVTSELKIVADDGLKYSAVIICISSHGNLIVDEDGIFHEVIHAQDGFYYKTELWRHFHGKQDWNGKPKLFFIQACRGEDATAGVIMSHDACDAEETTPIFTDLTFPDLFIMNASQQGTVSWKCNNGDSLFVDALIKIFSEKSSQWDLMSMAVEISDRVAREHEVCTMMGADSKYNCCQQMPCFETTLTKRFYFPNATMETRLVNGNEFYRKIQKPLAIVLNYSYEGTNYPNNAAKARINKNAVKVGLTTAGFEYRKFWDVTKEDLPKVS
ncbi:caspase-3-like [Culicoides brevitarsis]|uniref:caspase-3-like n=1 Tax=Culicoides brevitarsis TaxID=469753 RepID=UPI00307C5E49